MNESGDADGVFAASRRESYDGTSWEMMICTVWCGRCGNFKQALMPEQCQFRFGGRSYRCLCGVVVVVDGGGGGGGVRRFG